MYLNIAPKPCQGGLETTDRKPRDRFLRFLRVQVNVKHGVEKQECLASEIGVDASAISHWAAGRRDLPAWRLPAFTLAYGPGPLDYIAQRCGFVLLPKDCANAIGRGARQDGKRMLALLHCVIGAFQHVPDEAGKEIWDMLHGLAKRLSDVVFSGECRFDLGEEA